MSLSNMDFLRRRLPVKVRIAEHPGPAVEFFYRAIPHIGWYETLIVGGGQRQTERLYRWWNGERWSYPAMEWFTAEQAGERALVPSLFPNDIIMWKPIGHAIVQ